MTRSDSRPAVVRDYPFPDGEGPELSATFAHLRTHEPVCRVRMPFGGEAWLVTRYSDVRRVLTDPRLSRAASTGREVPRALQSFIQPGLLTTTDGAEHARLRRLAASAFTPRRIADLRPRLDELAVAAVGELVAHGPPSDLLDHLARPLPVKVIQEMLGIPHRDRGVIERFTSRIAAAPSEDLDALRAGWAQFCDYLGCLAASRWENPTEDLLSDLVAAARAEGLLSEVELVQLVASIVVAGYDTTAKQIANFAYLLLRDRAGYELLVADPALIPGAVEELLRFMPFRRAAENPSIAREDIRIGGTVIRAGEAVVTALASANRDEWLMANGNRLDIAREPTPHLAFGHGPHFCVGAHLARSLLHATLVALVDRLPGLRLAARAEELTWKPGVIMRELERLPVAW